MVEHSEVNYEKLLYSRAASALKVHGILAIIFGGLAVLGSILFTLLITLGTFADESYDSYNSPLGLFLVSAMIFVLWTLPHIYLIAAGIYLMREPSPKLARTLVIINLVIGVFYNLILLVIAIVNLTQITDYERTYHVHKKN
ncbi:MAG: hypothetical protein JWM52_867 [Candidatus Saccharibacteria bacterium]|nr:hypothetical protein [Candidatus Saccharibacteria bacterium]